MKLLISNPVRATPSTRRSFLARHAFKMVMLVVFFSGNGLLLSAQSTIPKYLKFSVEKNYAVLKVRELVGRDMSENEKDDFIEFENKNYQNIAWSRIAPPTLSHDCAGLVLLRLTNGKPYKIGADNFYHNFIQRFGKRLQSVDLLKKNDIVVFMKTAKGISYDRHGNLLHADHVALVVNDVPARRTSSLIIHTKDESQSTFENITNLENPLVYGSGEFWTNYGSIRNAQFWRIEKIPYPEFVTETEYWRSLSFANLNVDVYDGETTPPKPLTEGSIQVLDFFGNALGEAVAIKAGSATFIYNMSTAKGPPWRVVAKATGYQERWSDLGDEWRDPDHNSPPYAIYLNKGVNVGDDGLNLILNTTFDFIWGGERKGTITFSADGKAHPSWTKENYTWTSIKPSSSSPTSLNKIFVGKDYVVVFPRVLTAPTSWGFEGEIDRSSPKQSTVNVQVRTPEIKKPLVLLENNNNGDNNTNNNQSIDKFPEANKDLQLLKILQAGGQLTNPGPDDLIHYLRNMVSRYNLQKVRNNYDLEDCLNAIRNYQQYFGNVDVFAKVRDTYTGCLTLMIQELEAKIVK